MAGGVAKTFGVIFVLLGVVAILAGIAVAGYAYLQDQEQQDEGFGLGYSQEEQEQNQMVALGGVGLAATGLLGVIVGIILIVVGAGRARDALVRDLSRGQAQAPPAQANGPDAATAPADPDEAAVVGPMRAKPLAIGAAIAFAVVLLLALPILFGPSGTLTGSDRTDSTSPQLVDQQNLSGSADGAAVGPAGSLSSGQGNVQTFTVPSGATRLDGNLTWQAQAGGAEDLVILLERVDQAGGWDSVTSAEGTSPVTFEASVSPGDPMQVRVFVGGTAGGSLPQDYTVELRFWDR